MKTVEEALTIIGLSAVIPGLSPWIFFWFWITR